MLFPFCAQYKRETRSSSLSSLFVQDNIRSRRSFKKSDESESLCRSLQKEQQERFALKKRAIHMEIQRVNS